MLWIISAVDKPDAGAMRMELRAAHREYLATVNHRIFYSARQETDDGVHAVGTLFIIEADDRAAAEKFIREEPFERAGMFESVSIRRVRTRRLQAHVAGPADP
jgi:uncharacterized protein YciI